MGLLEAIGGSFEIPGIGESVKLDPELTEDFSRFETDPELSEDFSPKKSTLSDNPGVDDAGDTSTHTGGSYREVRDQVVAEGKENKEVHHMPADSASPLERDEGPAIEMDKEDHRQTASCGSSREAREYREMQREKIENGDFRGALQMDIDDIHEKFGDKYDEQINEMMDYVDQLEEAGKI